MGKLYIVPTPIGNLEDITLRAIRVLKEVDLILAEDTRKTKILLNTYQVDTRIVSHHKFNEHKTVSMIVEKILSGFTIALVSDAGTPGISDPGYLLIRECIKKNVLVQCLPGATAFLPALVSSGIPSDTFIFFGFLPHKKGRQKKLQELAEIKQTIILYESPFRILKTLEQLAGVLGNECFATVSRELTKVHEETVRGSLKTLIDYFSEKSIKGEFVIVIDGRKIIND
jgi:16S rRNA (cytidine1402-2'-O)-methyltransferase